MFTLAAPLGRILAFTALGLGLRSEESAPWVQVPGSSPPSPELVVRPSATSAGVVLDDEDQVARLAGGLAVRLACGLDHAQHVQAFSCGAVREAVKLAAGAVASCLATPVTLVEGLDDLRR